jgi:hypothetical protein
MLGRKAITLPASFLSRVLPRERCRGAMVAMSESKHRDVTVRVLRAPRISAEARIFGDARFSDSQKQTHLIR